MFRQGISVQNFTTDRWPIAIKFKVYEALQVGERESKSLAEFFKPFQT